MRVDEDRRPWILIADDQTDVLEALRLLIKAEGYVAEAVTAPAAALHAIEARDFDAVLMDLNYTRDTTSGQEGLELLERILNLDAALPVIVMTAWGSVELAVEAMRRAARAFIQKPWDNARLSAILKTQIELGRALRKGQRLEEENRALRAERFPQLIAQSAAMRPDRKSTRLNSSHLGISYAVFCLKNRSVLLDRKSTRLNSSHLGISYAVFSLIKKPQAKQQARQHRVARHLTADGHPDVVLVRVILCFFFNDPAATEFYPLSLHDALPI